MIANKSWVIDLLKKAFKKSNSWTKLYEGKGIDSVQLPTGWHEAVVYAPISNAENYKTVFHLTNNMPKDITLSNSALDSTSSSGYCFARLSISSDDKITLANAYFRGTDYKTSYTSYVYYR